VDGETKALVEEQWLGFLLLDFALLPTFELIPQAWTLLSSFFFNPALTGEKDNLMNESRPFD